MFRLVVHTAMATLGEYRQKRGSEGDARALRLARAGRRTRSSSSSGTTPGGSTTTFGSNANGALASWAVPKGVPLEPGEQHLAVHVEDHPLDYADFEGEIPKGNYGAGTVEIWDRGTYELVEEKRNGGLTVRLHGEKLQGTWALVPAKLSRRPEELADAPQARRRPRSSAASALQADARHAGEGAAEGRGLAVRGQVGRLPGDLVRPWRRGASS